MGKIMKFIRKLCIKNYRDIDNPQVRLKYGRVAGTIGICSNILMFIIKILIGILSASITIIVDAVNNLTDAGSSILTLVGFKLASKPADRDHPYGHARFEYVMGLIISMITFAAGLIFAKSCFDKIINPTPIDISILTYIILVIGIAVKIFQMLMYRDFSQAIDSDTLKANEMDARLDLISSSTIFISMIVMNIFSINIDGYIGLLVSLFIIYSSFRLILETINPLISEKPEKKLVNKIKRELLSFNGIIDMHDLLIHSYGLGATYATVHVEVPAYESLLNIHELIDEIERHFEDKFGINLTIQIDPIDKDNPRTQKIHDKVEKTIKKINKKLSIHGLRVIYHKDRIKVLFDITEDFEFKLQKSEIKKILNQAFSNESEQFEFIFTIDKPFI